MFTKNISLKNKQQFIKSSDDGLKVTMSIEIKSNHVIDAILLSDIERQINQINMNAYEKKTQ